MKTLLLNLPNRNRVIRRYMCSYNAPHFLFPPLELMSLGSIITEWKKGPVRLIDAIAERLSPEQTIGAVREYAPEVIVFLTGFEIFGEDMQFVAQLKQNVPHAITIGMGYYPTLFPEEILRTIPVDILLLGETELVFSRLYDRLKRGEELDGLRGVAYRVNNRIVNNGEADRISDLDGLPFPNRNLIKESLYREAMMPRPFTTMQTSRGCPYPCSYCVRTFGRKLVLRSVQNICEELEDVHRTRTIRSLRFIDDTFNVNKQRVEELCNAMIARRYNFKWTCLSRIDTLDENLLQLMKESGCKRMYLGVESGSQRILDAYNKGYEVHDIMGKVKCLKEVEIETAAFFMIGAPGETEEDINKTLQLAKEADFDYIMIFRVIPYPGTPLFEAMKSEIDFSLFPYRNQLKDTAAEKMYFKWEKYLYKRYYFRISYIIKKLALFIRQPWQALLLAYELIIFIFGKWKKPLRKDFL